MFRRTPEPPQPSSSSPALSGRRFTDAHAPCDTAVGPGVRVKGTLAGSGSVEIAGTFEGPIEIDGLFHILEGGRVVGDVTAHDAVIAGELQGRIVVAGRMELSGTARVRADVEAPTIAIAEGSVFDGRVNMGGLPAQSTAAPPPETGAVPAPLGAVTFREKRKKRGSREDRAPVAAAPSPVPPAPVPAGATSEPAPGAPPATSGAAVPVSPPADTASAPVADPSAAAPAKPPATA